MCSFESDNSMRYFLFIILFFSTYTCLFSQINVKIGYALDYVNASVNNEILEEFNALKRTELSDSLSLPFSGLNALHGVQLGLRFKFSDNNAFELNWENSSRTREAIGELNNSALFQQELFYSFNRYYISYESIFGQFGFGVGAGLSNLTIKDRIGGSDFKKTVIDDSSIMTRFKFSIYFQSSNTVSFAIQPYFQVHLSDFDLSPLREELGLQTNVESFDSFPTFGINFVFYNGRQ